MTNWKRAVAVATALFMTPAIAVAEDTMRLEWVMQGQFAGPIVAYEKGYYKEAGIDLKLLPAGPDLKPAITVAQGTDTFGIGHPNQVITARANDVPLVTVLQLGQKSATTYIARKDSGIKKVEDMPGHSVGLWFGGDEQEFMAMLRAANVDPSKVNIISQGFDIVGWLNKQYEVMQVTRYNELQLVYAEGYKPEDLVFLNPEDYGVAFVNTGVFATEAMIKKEPAKVQAMVDATLRGWQDALSDPEAAAKIVVKYNGELTEPSQVAQIKAMGDLICAGPTLKGEFGKTDPASWERVQKVLLDAKIIEAPIALVEGYTNTFWDKAPEAYKKINCPVK
ncbi:ABC transporter substrate-binding protein [Ancylobacter sp. A5.8]|uniref:ABC transporter substrate-binding protein n=1 Tax=Ancylobacter gelatini TaxID=2919920 RepID=UPI001F4E3FC0|nr:ABC transporter substrate-binding protein [Ancylobacter gelatini]MCJ8142631.1 ABC transporter substrate-binding protein [Ancylobacter gelatini]